MLEAALAAAKCCQTKFGKKTELATDSSDEVLTLCSKLELIIQHGLKPGSSSLGLTVLKNVKDLVSNNSNSSDDGGMWRIIRTVLNRHEFDRFTSLRSVHTDAGRGRAWLRSALNEQSLEKYFNILLGDEIRLREFYDDWSFMRDTDRTSLLPTMASSLCSIRFALKIDHPDLNGDDSSISASLTSLLPSSLKPATAEGEATVAEEAPQEVIIDTSRLRTKKKKKVKSHVAAINEARDKHEEETDTDHSTVNISSPFQAADKDTEQLTAKLNKLLGAKVSETREVIDNIDIVYDAVDLGNASVNTDDDQHDFYTGPVTPAPAVTNKSVVNTDSLTPVTNKSIGALFPVLTSRASILSEDQAEDTLSNTTIIDDADYAVHPNTKTPTKCEDVVSVASVETESVMSGSSIKQSDLKHALLSVMEKKNDLEEQVTAIKKLLDQEINHVAEAKQELNDIKQIHKEKLEKLEARNSILARENELLKHQLKKYVGAVQKLRDGPQAYETLAQLEGIREHENKKYIDYHYEASEYEKKLIQVMINLVEETRSARLMV